MINKNVELANDNLTILVSIYDAGKCIISDRFGYRITILFPLSQRMTVTEDLFDNHEAVFYRCSGPDLDFLANFDFKNPSNIRILMSGEVIGKSNISLKLIAKNQPRVNEINTRFWDTDPAKEGGVYVDWADTLRDHPAFDPVTNILSFPEEGHFYINSLIIGGKSDPRDSGFSKIRIGKAVKINKTLFEHVDMEELIEVE
jgi:hypothetical protein